MHHTYAHMFFDIYAGALARVHPSLLLRHLPKLAEYLGARARDRDGGREIRDALSSSCALVMQELRLVNIRLATTPRN